MFLKPLDYNVQNSSYILIRNDLIEPFTTIKSTKIIGQYETFTLNNTSMILTNKNYVSEEEELIVVLLEKFFVDEDLQTLRLSFEDRTIRIVDEMENFKKSADFDDPFTDNEFPHQNLRTKRNLIYKDTKWCGPGNISTAGFDDLGPNKQLDSCCRDHDYCPINIPGFTKMFGIFNFRPYTLSHCECDRKFMDCLKQVNTFDSSFVGKLYFNFSNKKCFTLDNQTTTCATPGIVKFARRRRKKRTSNCAHGRNKTESIANVASLYMYKNRSNDLMAIFDFAYSEHLSNQSKNSVESEDDRSKRSLIYKDTKWCGPGNISTGYDDLGDNRALDYCCRDHDYCPISIPAMATKFGLRNTNLYTLSHCECDRKFMNCLRKVDTFDSNFVGMMYFNIANTQCFNFVNRTMCKLGEVFQNPISSKHFKKKYQKDKD
uniref:Phospholipase A2 domain-containing protein n=1 Tax=Romanomermis culicivorax TaxID=13658 RepID=A0A915HF25_ROMCU